jgi:hypothetical protein
MNVVRAPERVATLSKSCDPNVRLNPFVDAYWSRAAFHDGRTMRVLPDASSYLIFELAGERAGSAYVVGTHLRPIVVELNGEVDRVGITFRPGMANMLLRVSARDFRDRVGSLRDARIRLPPSLLDGLSKVPDFRSRVGAIESWLLGLCIDLTLQPGETRSSWTFQGKPLPYVPFPPGVEPTQSIKGVSWLPVMEAGLDDVELADAATIAVEKCTGPVLLVSGGDDRVWPTARMCNMLVDRMAGRSRGDRIRHLHYPRAGHMLFPYSRPADTQVPEMPVDHGGSPEDDAAAHADAWPTVLACLRGGH